jgi:hypothetical protein
MEVAVQLGAMAFVRMGGVKGKRKVRGGRGVEVLWLESRGDLVRHCSTVRSKARM